VNAVSPTLVNEASAATSYNTLPFYREYAQALSRTKLGIDIPQRNPSRNARDLIPDMTFSGIGVGKPGQGI